MKSNWTRLNTTNTVWKNKLFVLCVPRSPGPLLSCPVTVVTKIDMIWSERALRHITPNNTTSDFGPVRLYCIITYSGRAYSCNERKQKNKNKPRTFSWIYIHSHIKNSKEVCLDSFSYTNYQIILLVKAEEKIYLNNNSLRPCNLKLIRGGSEIVNNKFKIS